MTQMQSEDGFVHLAYFRADKGLSFTWNGLKGAKADVAYGGYGEPVFATIGLGDFENAPSMGLAFARFQEMCDRVADNFDIGFWQASIDRAVFDPSWGERGPQTAAEYHADAAPELPDIPLALAGYHDSGEELPQRGSGYRSVVTAAGFTDAGEQRHIDGDRYCEARVGAAILRHAAAHGHRTDHLDFVIAVMREARRRFPRGGGEENTDIGRLGATIASYSSKPDWVA